MPKNTPKVPMTWARARSHSFVSVTSKCTSGRSAITIRQETTTNPPTNNGSVIAMLVS